VTVCNYVSYAHQSPQTFQHEELIQSTKKLPACEVHERITTEYHSKGNMIPLRSVDRRPSKYTVPLDQYDNDLTGSLLI
jgi:hypothetical protein